MSQWPSTKARVVLAALLQIGWTIKNANLAHHTVSYPVLGGQILRSRFMIKKKSVLGC